MRTGRNVAALGCRGANEAAIIAGYNALLDSQETALAKAHKALVSAAGEARFDDAMTRLYNYWAQPGAQAEFCAAASRVLARVPGVAPATIKSEEHTSELQSLMRTSYAVFCLKKKTTTTK